MAKFVLAGKSDCPHFAKAELLSDSLQRSLPNFRVHKIPVLPQEWKEWLEATCKTNGWKHEKSPLIWRELVDQGGKGMILGGFSDFLEHCQNYYNVTSEMSTETMLSVAADNLESGIKEQEGVALVKPLHVWISSALSLICSVLIPNLVTAEVFPQAAAVSLHLLDLNGEEEELQGMKMEVEDLALPLLHQVSVHTDMDEAFHGADVVLLLDERCSDDSDKNQSEEEEKEKWRMKKISQRYTDYGRLIDARADEQVKVVVCGDSFVNARCSLLVDAARSISSDRFVAMATQLETEARAIISEKLSVKTSDVTDVIVWGNISGSFYVDLQRAQVFNFNGPIRGPPSFSQSLLKIFHHRKWLESDFQDLVRRRRDAVTSKTGHGAAAMSASDGILTLLKAWNGSCGPDRVFSLGVVCPGFYGLPDGVVLSVPVSFADGKHSVLVPDMSVSDELKRRLHLSASELTQEKLASENDGDDKK
ncbi:putative malate dehydrogenase 1B [Solea solea]|uniref:putative malate dehydrogenase 1B n=1 Tax=Solea solea TaxID=90069 RepID=UPI00272DAFF7|nr:putative malate dehydrogenase 1B [Solea solea]